MHDPLSRSQNQLYVLDTLSTDSLHIKEPCHHIFTEKRGKEACTLILWIYSLFVVLLLSPKPKLQQSVVG